MEYSVNRLERDDQIPASQGLYALVHESLNYGKLSKSDSDISLESPLGLSRVNFVLSPAEITNLPTHRVPIGDNLSESGGSMSSALRQELPRASQAEIDALALRSMNDQLLESQAGENEQAAQRERERSRPEPIDSDPFDVNKF